MAEENRDLYPGERKRVGVAAKLTALQLQAADDLMSNGGLPLVASPAHTLAIAELIALNYASLLAATKK